MSTAQDLAKVPVRTWHRYDRRLVVVGIMLIIIGSVSVYSSNVVHPFQSTFNVLPGKFFKIPSNLRDQTTITGQFKETSGRNVTFYIMSSVQFSAFQLGVNQGSLFSLRDVSSGSVSWTSSVPDTYYLVFAHGTGLLATTEVVSFQRTYLSLDRFELIAGVLLIGLGALEVYWGLRPREGRLIVPGSPKNVGPHAP